MSDKNQIDDIVSMLDNFMANGGGHVNIDAEGNLENNQKKIVNTTQCNECSTGKWATACAVPTLHEGIDDNE